MNDNYLEELAEGTRFFGFLIDDVESAKKLLEDNDTQFSRRIYVRSFFALIEGNSFRQRQLALSAHKHRKECFAEEEVFALEEKGIRIKDNGSIEVKDIIIKFLPLFKLSNKLYCQAFNKNPPNYGDNGWNQLQKTVKIRNRITHPKSKDKMLITDKDLIIIKDAKTWYSENIQILL